MKTETLRVVLDTNVILSSISSKSPYRIVLDELMKGSYEACVTTEILLEYEEKIAAIFDQEVAHLFLSLMDTLPNVIKIDVYFNFQLITQDADDNKMVDAAFSGNAEVIVTNDKHFHALKTVEFPKVSVMKIEQFKDWLLRGA
ncbi:MAG: putative toxin-antitoxin system toxin component, PIN family [Bacteroidota bacterium]